MRLGNAGGNNAGKKYMKITGNEVITPENQMKYDKYNRWAANSFSRLQRDVQSKFIYDDDAFNETYIKIGMKVLYGGLDIKDYDSYFCRAYYTNYILGRVQKGKIAEKHEQIDEISEPLSEAYDSHLDGIIPRVTDFVVGKYNKQQADMFLAYFCDNTENQTFRSLAKKYSVTLFFVHKTINGILDELRNNSIIKTYQDCLC